MDQETTREREEVGRKNALALANVQRIPGVWIAAGDFQNWRATERSFGSISGIAEEVQIIATNGIVAWFLWAETANRPPLFGHVQCFSGKVKPTFSARKQSVPRARPTTLDAATELLKKLQKK